MAVVAKGYKFISQVFIQRGNIQRSFGSFPINSIDALIHRAAGLSRIPQTSSIFTSAEDWSEKKLEKTAFQVTKVVKDDEVVEKKTKLFVPKITLFTSENDMQVISVEEATKLAKRRNLRLVLVSEKDPNTQRAVYKLVSTAEYLKENQTNKGKGSTLPKNEKVINITSKIAEHDLQAKINHILKWLTKERSARVIITGSPENLKAAELVYDAISDALGNAGRIVQKVSKHGEIKFQVLPPKKPKSPKSESSEENTP